MKIAMIFLFSLSLFATEDVDVVLNKLQMMQSKPKQEQVLYSPFKKPEPKGDELVGIEQEDKTSDLGQKTKQFSLKAIFNSKAFINNSWYKTGDTIEDFTVKKISNDSVVLMQGNNLKEVQFTQYKQYLKVKEEEK